MSRKIQFVFLLLVLLSAAAQSSFAQADPPLNYGTTYAVTGDYVVAGAKGLNASFGSDGLGTGIISFPDGNPGIRGTTTVPKGANILGAILYWQTVEKTGLTPGQPGTGRNGFFGPVINGKPRLYPISGLPLPSQNAVSFSNGGCSGTSNGKLVRTYRADVRGYLPLDASGNVLVDSADGVTFEVRLPNVGNNTPLTFGATLVLIFRVISPNYPLSFITIYDGAFAPNTTPNFTMTQLVQGFYQAGPSPVSTLTHIVGAGLSNKFQQAYLSGGQSGAPPRAATALPSLYGNGQPEFPGYYGRWDTTKRVFGNPLFPQVANPLEENDDSATATVVASGANPGCVSWAAVIVGTTVRDDDHDGILEIWKQNQGYTDVPTGQHVDLTGATIGHQDVFIQLDHVVDSNGNFTPDAAVVTNVANAFLAHGVYLHITDASQTTHIAGANAISEPAVSDGTASCNGGLCPYPNQIGITTWRDGFELIETQPLNYNSETDCEANSPPLVPIAASNCVRRFPPQQRLSYHYAVWGDTLGGPNWTFLAGLTDSTGTGAGLVAQNGSTTVTFYTTRGHGLVPNDNVHGNGRVTVANAITNPSLNGTHLVTSVACPTNPDTLVANDCSTGNRALGPYSFTITIGNSELANYTLQTDPYLLIASGQAGAGSGFSDVGGPGTVVTLFQWGASATRQAKEGTFLHELGHTLGLLHGGGDNTNCKPNYQSVMNYMFQAHLLGPSAILDLSNQQLSSLDETNLLPIKTMDGSNIAIPYAKWYDTKQTFVFKPNSPTHPAAITSFAINSSNVVTFQAANSFTAGTIVDITGLTIGTYLNNQVLTVSSSSGSQFTASFVHASVPSTADSGTAVDGTLVPIGTAAGAHCDGSSLTTNDPTTYKYGQSFPAPTSELNIPWSITKLPGLDVNFEGNSPGKEPHPFNGYDDWANADYRQVGAGGNEYFSVPGGIVPGGPGGIVPGGPGGLVPGGPGGIVPGGPGVIIPGGPGVIVPGGPGGIVPGGPGVFVPGGPGISGGGGKVELDFSTAVSTIDPPSGLQASEEMSARIIDLSWNPLTFPVINQYNVYRSSDQGGTFSLLKSVPGPTPTFPVQDPVTCNPLGYQYFVTAVFNKTTANITSFAIASNVVTFQAANSFTAGTTVHITGLTQGTYLNGQVLTVLSTGLSSTQFKASFTHANVPSTLDSGTAVSSIESAASNTVSSGQNGDPLTGCYAPTATSKTAAFNFTLPANAVQGSIVPITWTLQDLTNTSGVPVNRAAANTLVVTGPGLLTNGCAMNGDTIVLSNGTLMPQFAPPLGQSTFPAPSGGIYTLNLDTDVLCAGNYTVKLTLDSTQTATAPLQLGIDVNDSDNPHPTTLPLTAGTVGLAYNNPLTEHGGTAPFTWSMTAGALPVGFNNLNTGTVSGTTCAAGSYKFTAMVTDSKSNSGTQPLTLQINPANTTTSVTSNGNPSVFQQVVTFTVTVAPQYTCTPTGTVTLYSDGTQIGSGAISGGTATFTFTPSTLSVGNHNITASYSGDLNFNPSSSGIWSQTVNKASTTTIINSVLPSPAVVGQPISVAYTLGVVSPGGGTPIGPSGTITVMSSDGSSCMVAAALGSGACALSPTPTMAGIRTLTVTYSGDGNFVGSAANGNYTVYIYVSDTAPPPFNPTTTLPNAVVGSPYGNTVYESGGVTTGPNNFLWTIVPGSVMPGGGSTLPGIAFQANAAGVTNGTLSGTPTSAGTFTFTGMVTDSASPGNTGTQNLTITVLAAAPAPYGLVSWYPFEGNANDLEKNNNGSVVGTPQFVPAEVDNGLKPGPQQSGSLVTVPDSPTLALTQFTIGAWVRVDAIDNVQTMQIVWKGDNTAGDLTTPYSLSVLGSAVGSFSQGATVVGTAGPGKVLVILTDGTHELDVISTNALPLDGKFHYVAVTADGLNVNLYIDGVLDPNTPASEASLSLLPFTPHNPLQIGGIQGVPALSNNFDGVIDELQIWNRPLTAAEVSGIFTTVGEYQPAARPAGLVSWWPAEGNYTDIIGGNNGAPTGKVGFAPGEAGQAFSFNNATNNAEITVADNANLDVGQITIEAWVKPTTSGHGRPIVQKRSSANVGGYTFETTDMSDGPGPTNGLQFAIWISGTQYLLQTPANALTIGAWQHVAATFDGSTMTIYVNGVPKASQAASGSIDTDSLDPLVMGLNVTNPSWDWNGLMDEVSLYNRALTPAEIQSIVNAGGAGKAKP